MKRKKVLWLASWYPHPSNPYDGDFIQRHARAAAIYNDIHLLFIKGIDEAQKPPQSYSTENGLIEQLVFFKTSKGFFRKFRKQIHWFSLYKNAVKEYIIKNGLPDIVHVHVPWKAGLIALYIKKKYGLPYVITEHWGIYNHIVDDNYFSKPFYFRYLVKYIFEKSTYFISVSNYLAESINQFLIKKPITIIPNCVDTSLFYLNKCKHQIFTFIHVSNMVDVKNVTGILNAFKAFLNKTKVQNVQLVMVGNQNDFYKKMAYEMGLNNHVDFKGEIAYSQVAIEMQKAHCLVLNSHIENSPCVIGEAHCCGLPVIATKVGGIPELVNAENGILIAPNDDTALTNAFQLMYKRIETFDNELIAIKSKAKYAYTKIAKQFDDVYKIIN